MKKLVTLALIFAFCSCDDIQKNSAEKKDAETVTLVFKATVNVNNSDETTRDWQNFSVLKEKIKGILPEKAVPLNADSICQNIISKTTTALDQLRVTEQNIPADIDHKSLISRFLRLETHLKQIKNTLEEAQKKRAYQNLKLNFDEMYLAYDAVVEEIKRLSSRKIDYTEIQRLSIDNNKATNQ